MKEALNLGVSCGGSAMGGRGDKRCFSSPASLFVFALAIALPLLFVGHAAWAGDAGYLSVGSEIGYGGYSTNYFMVDGEVAYCATPSKGTPPAGTYTMSETDNESLAAALWYGWGGPGFDVSMWPDTWYDGSPMDADKYVALTHILVSDCYGGNGNEAYGQCSRVFQEWCQYYVVGYSIDNGARINGDALGVRLSEVGFAAGNAHTWPTGFSAYVIETRWGSQTMATYRYAAPGSIGLYKVSSDPDLVEANSCYSLAGATYGVYSDVGCSALVGTMTTNDSGYACCEGLAAGSYWVCEETPSPGFLLDEHVYPVTVRRGEMAIVELQEGMGEAPEDPLYATAGLLIKKSDAENGSVQGDATLEEARFTLEFYGGAFESADAARGSGTALRCWMVQTDTDGCVKLNEAGATFVGEDGVSRPYLVEGDPWWTDDDGTVVFPLGTLVIREVEPPRGYLLDDKAFETVVLIDKVKATSGSTNGGTLATCSFADEVVRGGVGIEKIDAETGVSVGIGAARLENVVFAIVNESDSAVCVGGRCYEPGGVVMTLALSDGHAETSRYALPYGSYRLEEVSPGVGYRVCEPIDFVVDEEQRIVQLSVANQVVRGDIVFEKRDESTDMPMAHVVFRITSTTTGESHIVISDDEGVVSTASSHALHTLNTNVNDSAIEDGTYDAQAGVWFGLSSEGITDPRDDCGALPYDTYLVEELSCEANAGRQLIEPFTVVIGTDGALVDLGLIEDKTATVGTVAALVGADGDLVKVSKPTENARVIDTVRYANLVAGRTYEVCGWLVDATTGSVLSSGGEEVRASTTFVADSPYGSTEVTFDFDATELDGHVVVVFEQLLCEGRLLAQHCDFLDEGQTIRFEDSGEPYDPDVPDDPIVPQEPDESSEPDEPSGPDTTSTTQNTGASTVAKTGDVSVVPCVLLAGIVFGCGIVLATLAVRGRRVRR